MALILNIMKEKNLILSFDCDPINFEDGQTVKQVVTMTKKALVKLIDNCKQNDEDNKGYVDTCIKIHTKPKNTNYFSIHWSSNNHELLNKLKDIWASLDDYLPYSFDVETHETYPFCPRHTLYEVFSSNRKTVNMKDIGYNAYSINNFVTKHSKPNLFIYCKGAYTEIIFNRVSLGKGDELINVSELENVQIVHNTEITLNLKCLNDYVKNMFN